MFLDKRENASGCFWCSLASPPADSVKGMIKVLWVTFDMCQDLGMRIPLVFWSWGMTLPSKPGWALTGALLRTTPQDMAGSCVFGASLPAVQAQLKLEDIPTRSPGGSQPGSHPPRPKGEKLNQLCSETDSQEAKNTPTSGSGPYTSPFQSHISKTPLLHPIPQCSFPLFFFSHKVGPSHHVSTDPNETWLYPQWDTNRGKSNEKRKLISGSSLHRRNRREW